MNTAEKIQYSNDHWHIGQEFVELSRICEPDINLVAVPLPDIEQVIASAQALLHSNLCCDRRAVGRPDSLAEEMFGELGKDEAGRPLYDAIALLIDAFSCLFDLDEVGARLARLDRAMCPRFHVDRVGVRMITTFCGSGTEWVMNEDADRSLLASAASDDPASGFLRPGSAIQQLPTGYVALFKGELYTGNEGRGIIHRSPVPAPDEKRLVLTLDML
ncbi:DUF1826 domain-containing protein [Nitrincola sp. MINF-07-Sa-05]|uniref:DUF1826 domain-containing protein n=1 Tax=Nitrincola salilacus TaxID=3400273 RepID=UPI003917F712